MPITLVLQVNIHYAFRMETSFVQSLKLMIVDIFDLSKDALHIHIGLGLFCIICVARPHLKKTIIPLLIVAGVACLGEILDMRDDMQSFGYWRWEASLHDIVNTLFWPTLMTLYFRLQQ